MNQLEKLAQDYDRYRTEWDQYQRAHCIGLFSWRSEIIIPDHVIVWLLQKSLMDHNFDRVIIKDTWDYLLAAILERLLAQGWPFPEPSAWSAWTNQPPFMSLLQRYYCNSSRCDTYYPGVVWRIWQKYEAEGHPVELITGVYSSLPCHTAPIGAAYLNVIIRFVNAFGLQLSDRLLAELLYHLPHLRLFLRYNHLPLLVTQDDLPILWRVVNCLMFLPPGRPW